MRNNLLDNLLPLLPEMTLAGLAIALLMLGVFAFPRASRLPQVFTALTLLVVLFLTWRGGAPGVTVLNGMLVVNSFTLYAKVLVLLSALLVLFSSSRWLGEEGGRPVEFLVLLLFSTLGMMLMVSANHLLALYVGLELSSLALYVLAAFERDDAKSSEAGLKYFVLGALASGMLLFGMSFIYGFAGSLSFDGIAQSFAAFGDEAAGNAGMSGGVVVGMVLVLAGFCFKVAAVPFHMWSPDVYEGAPTPVTAFLSTASKISAFALFARVLLQPFGDLFLQWQQVVVFASLASMLVGALAALRQTNIKRLLAYSSISHAGFVLMGLAAYSVSGVQAMLVYLTLYLFMSAGAFACVLLMRRDGKYVEQVSDLAGLAKSRPWLAFGLGLFMFSLAGIPPLAGFFGKFYAVMAAAESGLMPLAVAGLLSSVVACYYYLRVIKFMYFDEPVAVFDSVANLPMRVCLVVCAGVTVLFCFAPGWVLAQASAAASVLVQ